MISLGTINLQRTEDVAATRNKILGLTRSLQFETVPATRIAFAISEQSRSLLNAGTQPELHVSIDSHNAGSDLVLKFIDNRPFHCTAGVAAFFETANVHTNPSDDGCSLELRTTVPPAAGGLNERFLQRERSRLAQKTRTQLMDELRIKNEQLEQYNSQLEQMVAERTAELQQTYEKIKRDLETAADYVRRLIPPPCDHPVMIQWEYLPSEDLGGDIFGYHAIDDQHFAVYLLDVTGHGVDSALLAVSVINVIRSASLPGIDFRRPGKVLEALNDTFPMEKFGEKLFTIWYGVFNPTSNTLSWSGGGHPEALLYTEDSDVPQRLESLGPMCGMMDGIEFDEGSCEVTSPARLFIYSDGAHEIHQTDGSMWDFEDFIKYMSRICQEEKPLETLLQHVQHLRGSDHLDDDFSAMELRF